MNEQLKENIKVLAQKSVEAESPDVAMKYAQAALNLAHAIATVKGSDRI